jgi:YfiH family protein
MSLIHVKRGDLEYFVPENIKAPETNGVRLIFAARPGGVSGDNNKNSPLYSLNLGFKDEYDLVENVENNYKIIADTLGFSVNNIIYAHQKHTDNILICDENFLKNIMFPLPDNYIYDAMITDIPGILLSVRTADCVPILFWDEENNAVGAAHCGWKGTLVSLQVKTVLKMREVYGTDLKTLKVVTGSSISKCCYEVSEDFYKDFINTLGMRVQIYFTEKDCGKYMCDLKGINKMLLLDVLDEKNIVISQNCTYCEEDLFFSHRRQGEYRGSHAAFIGIKDL